MCTVLLPQGVNPIAVKYIISYKKLQRILPPYFVLSDTHTHTHTHTQSAHKHKYYYYNLHNFFPVMHSNFHYIIPCFYLERIPYLYPCKSHDFMIYYTVSEHMYFVFLSFLSIKYAIVIYIFPYIISVLYN